VRRVLSVQGLFGIGPDVATLKNSVDVDVVVIGAGQAGLSAAYFLNQAGLEPETGFVVLDANPEAGGAWQHRWPSLKFGTAHRIHPLPGWPLGEVDASQPASEVVGTYYAAYEKRFGLPVHRPVHVAQVTRGDDNRLDVGTDDGTWHARAIINATGTWSNPFWPHYPGMETFKGRQLHTVDYRSADEFAGKHVVVVGGGNSAVQLLAEISKVTTTTWVTRREPIWREGPFTEEAGRAAVALVEQRVREGLPPQSVVSVTGLGLTPEVADAKARGVLNRLPMFDSITTDGVVWHDSAGVVEEIKADVILWCTGFRASLAHLAPLDIREPGGGIRMIGTQVAKEPRLHLVGYGPSSSTIGATRAGRTAASAVIRLLGPDGVHQASSSTALSDR
jgi:cation diffusion facilitator CzcD-associated flavoprotein CzcO